MINTAAMLGLGNDPAIQAIGNIGQGINTLAAMKERDVEQGRRHFKHEQEMDKRKIHDLKFVQEQEAATLIKYQNVMKDPQSAGLGALVAGAAMLGAISALANFKVPNFVGGIWDNLMDMLGLGGETTPEDRQEVEDAAETLRAHWPSADVAPPGAEPLRSVRDVRIGQRVRVLSLDIARTAMQSHPCGWNAQMEEFCGVLSKVLKKDDGDGTLQLSNPVAGGSCYWFSVGCCVKP